MFGIKSISIDFLTGSPVLAWLAFVFLLGTAVYLYLKTNPPLPPYLRIVLGALRMIAVAALFAALLEPVISFSREFVRPRKVALLVDKSASMEKVERGKSRSARVDSLLSSDRFARLKKDVELTTWRFGGNLAATDDKVDKERTSLGEVIYQLEKRELARPSDNWLLLTDGNSNSGRDPKEAASGLPTPIVAVDLSSDAGNFDIRIAETDFNPILFVGQPSEIKLKLHWHNAEDKNVTIELLDSNRVVSQARFSIDQQEGLGEVALKYVPTEPGQKILKANIPPEENEENVDNNHRSFSVKVLKSRLLTLLVTERPDYEVGFLKRFLDQSDKHDVELRVTGSKAGNLAGRFPSRQTELNRYDLVILHDPDPLNLESKKETIESYLSQKGGAVWLLMGEQFSRRGPVDWFNRLLPFYQTRPRAIEYIDFHGEPAEGNLFHPAVRLADNQTAIRKAWSELPPYKTLVRCDKLDPDAVILAYASLISGTDQKIPALGYKRIGPGKLLASAALPFWTWGFANLGYSEGDSGYGRFIEGTVSWLTVSDDFDPIRVAPEKEVFHRGEAVRFRGFAFDLGFRPIPGVSGTVELQGKPADTPFERDLIALGEGNFRAEFSNLSPGEYTYTALFEKDGRILKEDVGRLLIEPFSLEEFDQGGDPGNLIALSRLSGGDYFTHEDFHQALEAIDRSPVAVEVKGELKLWTKYWLLICFIVAASLEWLLRKANQLI